MSTTLLEASLRRTWSAAAAAVTTAEPIHSGLVDPPGDEERVNARRLAGRL